MTPVHRALADLPVLDHQVVQAGDRWIYSAGCNVRAGARSTARTDVEASDLAWLIRQGARVALLSHQGDLRDGTAAGTGHIARHLSARLACEVAYTPDLEEAECHLDTAGPGALVLVGNTRLHEGETTNDPTLAARFAALGDRVAMGGFSKAHRAHASNVGVLRHRPGFAARSLIQEIAVLSPWAGVAAQGPSVAVLGGTKPEKTRAGLAGLRDTYDVLVPGGTALNAVLAAKGVDIGLSARGSDFDACVQTAAQVVRRSGTRELHVPTRVVVALPGPYREPSEVVNVKDGVPPGKAIVDLLPEPWLLDLLEQMTRTGGRGLLAGTPSRYGDGHRLLVDPVLRAFAAPGVLALLLGGDTVAELPWTGPTSTGGGAALEFLAHGTTAVLEALRAQRATA